MFSKKEYRDRKMLLIGLVLGGLLGLYSSFTAGAYFVIVKNLSIWF